MDENQAFCVFGDDTFNILDEYVEKCFVNSQSCLEYVYQCLFDAGGNVNHRFGHLHRDNYYFTPHCVKNMKDGNKMNNKNIQNSRHQKELKYITPRITSAMLW